jgi:ABC-type Fe3+/spermidine/putrescine transport system ATPase subunit
VNESRPAVSITGVSKQFKAGVTALIGIDLDVQPREFVSLIGPSGCGKSTLLRIIGDLIEPSEGTVEVNGKPARTPSSTTGAPSRRTSRCHSSCSSGAARSVPRA